MSGSISGGKQIVSVWDGAEGQTHTLLDVAELRVRDCVTHQEATPEGVARLTHRYRVNLNAKRPAIANQEAADGRVVRRTALARL
jgi:hypothetical protein